MRGIANDPNQNGGYPEFLVNVVGANGAVQSQGPAPLDQPRIYFGPVIAGATADYAIVGKGGVDREYDYENNTETKNYTYSGTGGVPVGDWLSRTVFAAKFAERNFLFSNVIGDNSRILFNRDPAQRVQAVAPWLTTDSSMYPAIVNKRMVWIVDGYTIGSTGVAAAIEGRRFLGAEIRAAYVETAATRIGDARRGRVDNIDRCPNRYMNPSPRILWLVSQITLGSEHGNCQEANEAGQ